MLDGCKDNFGHVLSKMLTSFSHAPLGCGLLHSVCQIRYNEDCVLSFIQTIEDLFLGARTGALQNFGPYHGWLYLGDWMESMNFRSRSEIQDLRDIFKLTAEVIVRSPKLAERLNDSTNAGLPDSIDKDLEWRAQHLGLERDFWTMNGSDLPMQVSEGLALRHEPKDQITPSKRPPEILALSRAPLFGSADDPNAVQMVRNAFRFFHRSDGM